MTVVATLLVLLVTFIRQDSTGVHIAVASWFYAAIVAAVGALAILRYVEHQTM
ncbi:MAG: hypothetical protein ACRDFX_09455 [Chloroflexota bacterium]